MEKKIFTSVAPRTRGGRRGALLINTTRQEPAPARLPAGGETMETPPGDRLAEKIGRASKIVLAFFVGGSITIRMTTDKSEAQFAHSVIDALNEALHEIKRINKACGATVFNPSATQILSDLKEESIMRAHEHATTA